MCLWQTEPTRMRGLNISILLSSGTGQQCTRDSLIDPVYSSKGPFAQLDLGAGVGGVDGCRYHQDAIAIAQVQCDDDATRCIGAIGCVGDRTHCKSTSL